MEYVLSKEFSGMSQKDMEAVNGGFDLIDFAGGFASGAAGKAIGKRIGATIGGAVGGPIGGVVGGILGVAAFEVIYHLNN